MEGNKTEMKCCPVCSGTSLRLYQQAGEGGIRRNHSITRASYGTSKALLHCVRCQVIFADPFPTEVALQSLYETMEDSAYIEEDDMRRRMAMESLSFIEQQHPKGRLLDVGCFSGIFLDVAKKRGWDVVGIEPSHWGRKIAQERFGLKVLEGTLEEASLEEASFDVVTMIDTIEHLRDPKKTLLEARRILKENGIVYISTPDVRSFVARLLKNKWWGFREEHIVYFSKSSLYPLLEQLGFRVSSERSYRRFFSIEALIKRLKETSPFFYGLMRPLGSIAFLKRRLFVLNFFDQLELVAERVQ